MNTDFDLKFSTGGLIAGVDEAGRGPLAGPVVVCAIVMHLCPECIIKGVDDSKKLTERKREELYDKITAASIEYATAVIDNEIIDKINILNAVKRGMTDCINRLHAPVLALIDYVKLNDTKIPVTAVTHGDAQSYSIACASVIAKVTRDRIMRDYDILYPQYGFIRHKGYATPEHLLSLNKHGVCPIHRKTFLGGIIHELIEGENQS